jgi:DNA-binding PadR family transcriptional regulator
LITAGGTDRDERYPERTTYHLTEAGRAASRQWIAEIVSTPRNEYPEFPAALSFLMMVTPDTAERLLEQRRAQLTQHVAEMDAELAAEVEGMRLPRVVTIDEEYQHAVANAELRWITATIEALRDGSLTWSREDFLPFAPMAEQANQA